jgi:regulator of protease activity HflC (stomatin/prohibitin superfamily)
MNGLIDWLQSVIRSIRPWVTVNPWEQGVRVRLGKHVEVLRAGVHLKIPGVHSVAVLATRVRVMTVPMQTVMSKDGRAVSVAVAIQYQIEDVERVFRSVHHPESTIAYWVQGIIGQQVRLLTAEDVTPEALQEAVMGQLDVAKMGLGSFKVFISDLALVRTYRLLQEGRWIAGESMDHLSRDA